MIFLQHFPHDVFTAISFVSLALALAAAATDLRTRRIPNLLTAPAALLALFLHFFAGGVSEALKSFASLMICGAVFLLFYLAGGMGAGDVKLIAAQGALLGLGNAVPLLTFTALAGGVLAFIVAARRGAVRQTMANTSLLLSHHAHSGLEPHPELNVRNPHSLRLPYALAIAAGTLLTLPFAARASW